MLSQHCLVLLLALIKKCARLRHVTKNEVLRLSMIDKDFVSIKDFTFSGTAEFIDPAPEHTCILVAVSGSK